MDSDEKQVIWKRVGQRVRTLRKSRGMSVDKLAADVGVVRTQLVRLEAGLGGTTFPRMVAIAAALGVTIEDLVRGVDPERASDRSMEMAFRGHGLSAEKMEKVLEYIEFLEHQREK